MLSLIIRKLDKIREQRKNLPTGEKGAAVIEYALLIGGVAVAALLAIFAFGGSVNSLINDSTQKISAVSPNSHANPRASSANANSNADSHANSNANSNARQ